VTTILVAATIFVVGLTMILKFRSVVSADDDLERRLLEARRVLADRKAEVEVEEGARGVPMTRQDGDAGS
jgi:hypothetical protein